MMYKLILVFALCNVFAFAASNSNRFRCEYSHKGLRYDLSSLMDQSYTHSEEDFEVTFSVCENFNALENVPDNCESNAAVCMKVEDNYFNAGSLASHRPTWSTIHNGVALTVYGGDNCRNALSNPPIQKKSTRMEFTCSEDVEGLEVVQVEAMNDCETVIRAKTQAACPTLDEGKDGWDRQTEALNLKIFLFSGAILVIAITSFVGIFALVAKMKRDESMAKTEEGYDALLPSVSPSAPTVRYIPFQNYIYPSQWYPTPAVEEESEDERLAKELQAQYDQEAKR